MAKRTKTQKRRALISVQDKSWRLCGEGLISVKDYEMIFKATTRALNKL